MMQKTILLVEDDIDIQEMIELILSAEGYNVVCTNNDSFIDNLAQLRPSLILMDNQLSGISGVELCRQIKENAAISTIPVVLLSANSKLEQMAFESKADGFLAKPFEINELVELALRYTTDNN